MLMYVYNLHLLFTEKLILTLQVVGCNKQNLNYVGLSSFSSSLLTSCCTCCHLATREGTPFFFRDRPGANLV